MCGPSRRTDEVPTYELCPQYDELTQELFFDVFFNELPASS